MAQENSIKNLSASGYVSSGPCVLSSMYVNSTSSGTLYLINGLSGSAAISGVMTPAAGFHNLGNIQFSNKCYASFGNGALDITFHIKNTDN
jgi:hypothetical protein